MDFLRNATRYLFFTARGGAGRTSVTCATAVQLADLGKRVLLVSADPSLHLGEVLGTPLGSAPGPVEGARRLLAYAVDPETAGKQCRERFLDRVSTALPAADVSGIEEQLLAVPSVELAAFDTFARLLADDATATSFEHVVFDTSPTEAVLRFFTRPSPWSAGVESAAGVAQQEKAHETALQVLRDPTATTILLVTRPDPATLDDAAQTSSELSLLGLRNQRLVINAVFEGHGKDPATLEVVRREEEALASMPGLLRTLPRTILPLHARPLVGIRALRFIDAPTMAE